MRYCKEYLSWMNRKQILLLIWETISLNDSAWLTKGGFKIRMNAVRYKKKKKKYLNCNSILFLLSEVNREKINYCFKYLTCLIKFSFKQSEFMYNSSLKIIWNWTSNISGLSLNNKKRFFARGCFKVLFL